MENRDGTLIIGLGNPLRGDDAAGFRVAEHLQKSITQSHIVVLPLSSTGMKLIDALAGFHRAIVIDAYLDPDTKPGELKWLTPDDLPDPGETNSHGFHLVEAIATGKRLGQQMPEKVEILAIIVGEHTNWSEMLSPEIETAVRAASESVLNKIS